MVCAHFPFFKIKNYDTVFPGCGMVADCPISLENQHCDIRETDGL